MKRVSHCLLLVLTSVMVLFLTVSVGCRKDVDKNVQGLCYEWTGRKLWSEILPTDKLMMDEGNGQKHYEIEIGKEFKGHGGNPYIIAKGGKAFQISCCTADMKPFPTEEEFRRSPVVVEITSRLGIEPRIEKNEDMGDEITAIFELDGPKHNINVSVFRAKGDNILQKDVTFMDYR